ncbi:MAG: hypothetical protein JWO42_2940 [Chloroflexi bacterium]|nr:hypothetical protein [Chloroflexota bacterium]
MRTTRTRVLGPEGPWFPGRIGNPLILAENIDDTRMSSRAGGALRAGLSGQEAPRVPVQCARAGEKRVLEHAREIYSEIASYSGGLDHALVYRRISEVNGLPLSDQGVAVVSSPNRAAGAAQYRDHCKERQ